MTSTVGTSTVVASTSTSTLAATTTLPVEVVTLLLTNDDGIGAPGIDAVAQRLLALPGVELFVVAPAEEQSGSSDRVSDQAPSAEASSTSSGIAGVAVEGTPADSVIHALDVMGLEVDLVVSGANSIQNLGQFVSISGTVGAARTAARRGIPAVAISAGLAAETDYDAAADVVAAEVQALLAEGLAENTDRTVTNLNTPTCAPGTSVRGVADVPVAATFPEGVDGINLTFDCASTATDPQDDVSALLIGYASRSIVAADL